MDFLDSGLHSSILSSLAANLASSSTQDDLGLLTASFSSVEPVTNGAINGLLARLVSDNVDANEEPIVRRASTAGIHLSSPTVVDGATSERNHRFRGIRGEC